jgi:hypothetical protein
MGWLIDQPNVKGVKSGVGARRTTVLECHVRSTHFGESQAETNPADAGYHGDDIFGIRWPSSTTIKNSLSSTPMQ